MLFTGNAIKQEIQDIEMGKEKKRRKAEDLGVMGRRGRKGRGERVRENTEDFNTFPGTSPWCFRSSCQNLILLGFQSPTSGKLKVSRMVKT